MDHDAVAWMLAPRQLFGGAAPIDACTGLEACTRGVLLHSLAVGVDADPELFDALLSGQEEEASPVSEGAPSRRSTGHGHEAPPDNVIGFRPTDLGRMRLFTATVVANDGNETLQAFHASLAVDEQEFAERLRRRIGRAPSSTRIFLGFDPTDALVSALVSEAMCDMLEIVAVLPTSPIAAGLDLNVVQRFFA